MVLPEYRVNDSVAMTALCLCLNTRLRGRNLLYLWPVGKDVVQLENKDNLADISYESVKIIEVQYFDRKLG